jgi:uracil-DNA glycosylase
MSIKSFFAPLKPKASTVSLKRSLETSALGASGNGEPGDISGSHDLTKKAKTDTADEMLVQWSPLEGVKGTWSSLLQKETKKKYFQKLTIYVDDQYAKHTVFPPRDKIFSAFTSCSFEDVKVVVIGQDPYHGPQQAHGLAFSVQRGVKVPPSLRNIYKELETDLGYHQPSHGCLEDWSNRGVLMLNTCLTVRKGEAFSHQKQGWEVFTDAVIQMISKHHPGLVFLLWGKPAQSKMAYIDRSKHKILTSSHPSPLGATKTNEPFIGSKCFSKCNAHLKAMGRDEIDWRLST